MSGWDYKLVSLAIDGTIFGVLALGIYVLFEWTRFPDLSPDGTFVLGAWGYLFTLSFPVPVSLGLLVGLLLGGLGGLGTATLNRACRVPAVIAGMLTSFSLYSVAWLLMGRPNSFIPPGRTLGGIQIGGSVGYSLLAWVVGASMICVAILAVFGNSFWGLRLRGICENPLLANDLRTNETRYIVLGLGIGNGLVGLAGALTVQRIYSVDVGMGFGITIAGLACMIIGMSWIQESWSTSRRLISVLAGALLYKAFLYAALELGVPPESYRLVTAGIIAIILFMMGKKRIDILRGMKWT